MKQPKYIIGVDEAGRGPLAGPVHVGLVVVPKDFDFGIFPKLTDSKKMTERQREVVVNQLNKSKEDLPIRATTAYSEAKTIDTNGIVPAIRDAIAHGLAKLEADPGNTFVYLDGSLQAPKGFQQKTIVKGDEKLAVISLASVIAKVARDQYMKEVGEQYPDYNFGQHKGYGTKAHREAIKDHGVSDIHRKSFLSNILQ